MIDDFRNGLKGCIDIFLFRREGIGFFSGSLPATGLSFAVLAATLPAGFMLEKMALDIWGGGGGTISHFCAVTLVGLLVILLSFWAICRIENRMDVLTRWISIANWMSISVFGALPVMAVALGGPWQEKSAFFSGIFLTLFSAYIILCGAFVIRNLLGISWIKTAFYTLIVLILQQIIPGLIGL